MKDLAVYQEALKKPSKADNIARALLHEERLRFHSETTFTSEGIRSAEANFLTWVKTLLPKDKYNTFVNLFKLPNPNIELTNKIYNELERVFDGKNASRNYQFSESKFLEDWTLYREKLGLVDVWRTTAWDNLKSRINSFIVVDLPSEQSPESAFPEPYFYFLDISNVIDYCLVDDTDKLKWIIFKQEKGVVAIIDQESYKMVAVNDEMTIVSVLKDNPHSLGYCPVAFFWTDVLSHLRPDLKEAPVSNQISNLDWLLFFSVSKRHLDLYAPYPIYSAYEEECDFENTETGDFCDGGHIRKANGAYEMLRDGSITPCPACSNKKFAGPGSFTKVPIPDKEGQADLRDPITITTIDKESLDYNVDECERIALNIYKAVVGSGGQTESLEALNKDHIRSNYDAKTSKLNNLKINIENAETFTVNTICKLRYGEAYINCYVNLGTEFYILSLSDLQLHYKQAKDNGSSDFELNAIQEQIIATEYRNNPHMMRRLNVLKHLEPYRHLTRKELLDFKEAGLLDADLLPVKVNFSNFIDRFERENTNVVEFGKKLDFEKRITIILNQLIEYGKESRRESSGVSES